MEKERMNGKGKNGWNRKNEQKKKGKEEVRKREEPQRGKEVLGRFFDILWFSF